MSKAKSYLLLGVLSIVYAEVLSGSSTMWFIDLWSVFTTLPIYLVHIILLLIIAIRFKKMSLPALYLFGVIFGLYESFITKVLWAGYMNGDGLGLGSFLGVGIIEFPILVFWWHPVYSFILPILTYQLITGDVIVEHSNVLSKSIPKTIILIVAFFASGAFIAQGNGYNYLSANISLIGSIFILIILSRMVLKDKLDYKSLGEGNIYAWSIVIVIIYILSFIFILPERIPHEVVPYVTIIVAYIIAIIFIALTNKTEITIMQLDDNKHYGIKDLVILFFTVLIATNIMISIPVVSEKVIIPLFYFSYNIVGLILFIYCCYYIVKKRKVIPESCQL